MTDEVSTADSGLLPIDIHKIKIHLLCYFEMQVKIMQGSKGGENLEEMLEAEKKMVILTT